ncbi:MAG: hypothetical protein WBF76_00655, partial [Pseudonocardiaceae bacterium]
MKPALRWVLVTALLASALVVALCLPTLGLPTSGPRASTQAAQLGQPAQPATESPLPSIEQLRSQAALLPCPAAHPGATRGPLSGLVL